MKIMSQFLIYAFAALAEIAGCFAFWAWLRMDKSIWLLVPGILSLIIFAALLTLIDTEVAGRAYAAYGGIYIVASLIWLRFAEDFVPDRWDIAGGVIALAGAGIVLFGPRA